MHTCTVRTIFKTAPRVWDGSRRISDTFSLIYTTMFDSLWAVSNALFLPGFGNWHKSSFYIWVSHQSVVSIMIHKQKQQANTGSDQVDELSILNFVKLLRYMSCLTKISHASILPCPGCLVRGLKSDPPILHKHTSCIDSRLVSHKRLIDKTREAGKLRRLFSNGTYDQIH